MKRDAHHGPTVAHEAMGTRFELRIASADPVYARQAAAEALAELDLIESRLSRFVENSDIARINRLAAGESTVASLDAFECLRIALAVQREMGGAFDVAYSSAGKAPGRVQIALDEKEHTVRVLVDGVRLDLGGIGKGFALDRMAALLREWDIESALLSASTSTLLALAAPPGERGWPVRFGPEARPRRLLLAGRAFSGSGTAVKGDHIVDPRTGRPAQRWLRAWAAAPTAAVADALSTAFMVMTEEEMREYCRVHEEVSACALEAASAPLLVIADRES